MRRKITLNMRSIALTGIFGFIGLLGFAQTVLVDPNQGGGFELGTSFAANGWTVSNSVNNPWVVGSAVTGAPFSGNTAYVSADGGTTNSYIDVNNCVNYFWRDVTVPAGETKIRLSFNWAQQGESSWDIWQVFTAPTSVNPTAAAAHPGSGTNNVPASIAGATYVANGSLIAGIQTTTVYLPPSLAGTTFRLIFSWKNEVGATQPPAAIDNISLTSQLPGTFISIATGNWSTPTTWDANAIPSPVDFVTVSTGHVVTIDGAGFGAADLIVNGTLAYGTVPTTFNVTGNLTVNTGGILNIFNGTTGKTLTVAKNIINDGTIDASVGTTTLTLNGSTPQSVSGIGAFNTNVIRSLVFSNTSTSYPNITWGFNNIKIATNLNLTGARVDLGTNKMTFGNNAAGGTLTAPNGFGFLPGAKFSRWWTATATGTAITAGALPTTVTSKYPFCTVTGMNRSAWITRTNATGAVAGELATTYTDGTGMAGVSIVDGAYTINQQYNGYWSVSNEGTPVSATSYTLCLVGENAFTTTTQNTRITGASTALSGVHQNGTILPLGQRNTVTQSDLLAGPLYLGLASVDYTPGTPGVLTQSVAPPTCTAGTTLTAAGTPESDVIWYWQSSAVGTSTTDAYTGPNTVFANGTYYLRAYNTVALLWSANASSITITNFPTATAPPAPIAAMNPVCVTTGTTISVASAPVGYTYYWQGTVSGGSSTANDASTPFPITATGTYYVAAYETASQCWSNTVGVTIQVDTYIPDAPILTADSIHICSGLTTYPLTGSAPGSGAATVSSGAVNLAIPDSNPTGITSTLAVASIPAGATITGIDVTLNITHTWDSDLDIFLVGANGTQIELSTDNGGSSDNYTNTILSSAGVTNVTAGVAPFTGTFLPEGAMASLYSVTNGNWSLKIVDDAGGDAGTLVNWSINISYSLPSGTLIWFDAAAAGTNLGSGSPFEAVGTSVLPNPTVAGTYDFYAEALSGACSSSTRTLITIDVKNVNVDLLPFDAICNGSGTGTFVVSAVDCGTAPFAFSVNGGAFGPAPFDLVAGTYTVTVRDAGMNLSPMYTVIIGEAAAPSGLVMVDITDAGGQVSWNSNGSELAWTVEYGAPGFTPGTGTEIESFSVTDTFIVITTMDPNTSYDVYVSADCGAGQTIGSWSPISFTTDCGIYSTLPFVETFEDTSSTRACWLNEQELGTSDWTYATGSTGGAVTTAFQGTKNARFVSVSGTNSPITKLVSPRFNFTGQDSVAVVFAYAQEAWFGDQNITKVYTSGASSVWTEIANYNTSVTTWTVDTLYVADTTIQIAFEGINNFGRANVIDNVQFYPCTLIPGTDGSADVCRLDNTFDLNSIITKGEEFGYWTFPTNETFLNGSIANIGLLPSGTYEFYYVVKTPCANDTTVATLTIFNPSTAGFDGSITVCRNEPVDLLSGLSGNVDLGGSWYDPSNVLMPQSEIYASNIPGQFNYDYITGNGVCPDDTANVLLTVNPACDWLSVEEMYFSEVTMYPNPTNGIVYISNTGSTEVFSYEVTDVEGRVIESKNAAINGATTTEINLDGKVTGIYLIRVYNANAEKVFRIILQ